MKCSAKCELCGWKISRADVAEFRANGGDGAPSFCVDCAEVAALPIEQHGWRLSVRHEFNSECVICNNEGPHDVSDRTHVFAGQE